MTLRKATLKSLTICPCGYGVLLDDVKVGTEFLADMDKQKTLLYRCGKCGTIQRNIACVGVLQFYPPVPLNAMDRWLNSRRHPTEFRMLPVAMFRFGPVPATGVVISHAASPEAKK